MSGAIKVATTPMSQHDMKSEKKPSGGNYKGFVAGVFSGIAKLSGIELHLLLNVDVVTDRSASWPSIRHD